jgi:hypothetical protein
VRLVGAGKGGARWKQAGKRPQLPTPTPAPTRSILAARSTAIIPAEQPMPPAWGRGVVGWGVGGMVGGKEGGWQN